MKAVLQRVKSAQVSVDGRVCGKIEKGLLIFLGVCEGDSERKCDFLAAKCAEIRIFEDAGGKMNLSVSDVSGSALVISQFTLCADCKKGRRPSFTGAARPDRAIPLYERFVLKMREHGITAETGEFGADMLVSIENDGPVTIILDTDEIMPKG